MIVICRRSRVAVANVLAVTPSALVPLISLVGPAGLEFAIRPSRYLVACEALSSTRKDLAFPLFEAAFDELDLLKSIRIDNGVPFASPDVLVDLSRLSKCNPCVRT
jgi:hypothetical protein